MSFGAAFIIVPGQWTGMKTTQFKSLLVSTLVHVREMITMLIPGKATISISPTKSFILLKSEDKVVSEHNKSGHPSFLHCLNAAVRSKEQSYQATSCKPWNPLEEEDPVVNSIAPFPSKLFLCSLGTSYTYIGGLYPQMGMLSWVSEALALPSLSEVEEPVSQEPHPVFPEEFWNSPLFSKASPEDGQTSIGRDHYQTISGTWIPAAFEHLQWGPSSLHSPDGVSGVSFSP